MKMKCTLLFLLSSLLSINANAQTPLDTVLAAHGENIYGVKNLADFKHRTAWVEGVEGYGAGERIIIKFGQTEVENIKDVSFGGIYILNRKL